MCATCTDSTVRNGSEAVAKGKQVCENTEWKDGNCIDSLAAAYAELGDFDSAVKYQKKAIELNSSDVEFKKGAEERLNLYSNKKPFRE